MRYDQQPIDFPAQITLLKERGMIFDDEENALKCLYSISYFRLASYWHHLEHRITRNFEPASRFEDVLVIYTFDHELRNLIFAAIQDIEIAFRTRVSHFLAMKYGTFWFLDATLFKDKEIHNNCIEKLKEEIDRSHEDFLKEHLQKYDEPSFPPSWKALEVASFGTLSKLYSNLTDTNVKKIVSRSFLLPSYLFLENWMKCTAVLRNCCAHHARLWNRRFSVIPKYPPHLPSTWINRPLRRPEKLYGQLCCLAYLEHSINPNSSFKKKLIQLMHAHPEISLKAMGFPENWQEETLWK